MDVISFMLVVWMLKILAEDTYHGIKGTPNPRAAARARRQRTRQRSRTWGALTNYWGDLVEDASIAATEARRKKAEKKRLEREAAEVKAVDDRGHPGYNQDPADPSVIDVATPPPREPGFWDLGPRDCLACGEPGAVVQRPDGRTFTHNRTGDRCPAIEPEVDLDLDDEPKEEQVTPEGSESPSPASDPEPSNVIPLFRTPKFDTVKENHDMSTNTEVTGLDPAIEYAKSLAGFAGDHATSGNEGYLGFLTQSKVEGQALASAHEMQDAFANAQAAAEKHQQELEKQKALQEAYNQNPDAGDKQFLQNGQ